jgi:aminoglycoside phosphotransferase (APT) family kinase protein
VSGGQWRAPAQVDGEQPGPGSATEGLLHAVGGALDLPSGSRSDLTIERQRLAGRSNIYVISSPDSGRGRGPWIVKQPHTEWSQDDVSNPLGARQEFEALRRLHEHFTGLGLPFRVPEPVAFVPDVEAVVMEYVDGGTVKDLLGYGSLLRPRRLLDGLTASGVFLRHLHTLDDLPEVEVDLKAEAEQVLAVAEEKLRPLGLDLPEQVRRTMLEFPAARTRSPQVRLHGDFGPANILLARDGSTVGLDASLEAVGVPEEDLVRYVALTSGIIRLAPELVLPPFSAVRRRMENRLLEAYYQRSSWPPLFELKYLHQLCRRWCRMRDLASQNETPARLAVKLRVIGAHTRLLMRDSERRLTRALEV